MPDGSFSIEEECWRNGGVCSIKGGSISRASFAKDTIAIINNYKESKEWLKPENKINELFKKSY